MSCATTPPLPLMRANSFFSGIGGFDLGLERSGFAVAFHCESDHFCRNILRRHWPEVPTAHDIAEVTSQDIPEADVWTGGFPCQDVSLARGWRGRDGLRGENSGLFFPFYDLAKEKLPEVLVLENVPGLLNSHKGKDFYLIIKYLSDLGYGIAWRIFNTRYFGAPQSRPRVYIIAWRGRPDLAADCLFEPAISKPPENPRTGFLREYSRLDSDVRVPEVSYCLAATSGRHTGTDWSRTYVAYSDAVRRLTPWECEKLQGFPVQWTIPTSEHISPGEDTDTLRYHALGNAVSVPVVEHIGARIAEHLGNNQPVHRNPVIRSTPEEAASASPELAPEKQRRVPLDEEPTESAPIKWRPGGTAFRNEAIDVKCAEAPNTPIPSRLIDIIDHGAVHEKYFLSPNAARGILRRVDGQKRKLFGPLDQALRELAKADNIYLTRISG